VIAEYNNLAEVGYRIREGMVLRIPPAANTSGTTTQAPPTQGVRTWVVQPGDVLSRIALATGVPWREIAELNGIEGPFYRLQLGQVLRIPAAR